MQIVIIDSSAQSQLEASQRILALPAGELDLLNLQIKLASPENYKEYLPDASLVILGPGLCAQFSSIAVSILVHNPHISILIFADAQHYCREFVSMAQRTGIRKTLPPDASSLDLLQELIAVANENIHSGRGRLGRIIAFTSAKGGAGVTSLVAGLGELLSEQQQSTLLWDFDCDSRDLCRGLNVPPQAGAILNSWIAENHIPTRDDFEKVMFRAHDRVSIMPMPTGIPESLDLCYHSDCQPLLTRLLELARCVYDVTLIDVGGANGESLKTILKNADEIVVLTGECALSVSACDFYLDKILHATGSFDRVKFLIAGSRFSPQSIKAEMKHIMGLSEQAWDLPALDNDPKTCNWPGSGRTMYSLGNLTTQATIKNIAQKLKLEINNIRHRRDSNITHLAIAYRTNKNRTLLGYETDQAAPKKSASYFSKLNVLKRA